MIVSIHQPQFMPWLGYFHKMMATDAFCLLDNVQFKKNEWQNRNRINSANGWQWLTVPVQYRYPEKIYEVGINNSVNWRRKHIETLKYNYQKSKYFREYFDLINISYEKSWESISELNCHLIDEIRNALGIMNKPIILASKIEGLSDNPTQRLIDICRHVGADTYLAGADGPKYMDIGVFQREGIKVVVQDFQHPIYPQMHGEFVSHLSIIDLLFNCGPKSAEIILHGK